MVRRFSDVQDEQNEERKEPSSERLTCSACSSEGPFDRAFLCCFKQEDRRHSYVLCASKKCEARFEKDLIMAAEKSCQPLKVVNRIKQEAKKGTLHCSQCFFQLKEVAPPKVEADIERPAPPPPLARRKDNEEVDCIEVAPCEPLELPFDIDNCVMHVKDASDDVKTPTAGKKGKKGKKQQGQTLNREVVQALFFEDPRRVFSEEGQPVVTRSPQAASSATSPSVTQPQPKSAHEVPEWPARAERGGQKQAAAQAQVAASSSKATPKSQPSASGANTCPNDGALKTELDGLAARHWPAGALPQSDPATPQGRDECEPPVLPRGWKAAVDPASKDTYYYHVQTREVTWDIPTEDLAYTLGRGTQEHEDGKSANAKKMVMDEANLSLSSASTAASESGTTAPSSAVSSTPLVQPNRTSAVQYLVIHSYTPRQEDRDCIRLIRGERVILEEETLIGWGFGSIVPEEGETLRYGHFPRWALSPNPAPAPKMFVPGARAMVIDDYIAPANGYLSMKPGEILVVKYQVDPLVWVWAEATSDPGRRGWVPEAVLILI